MPLRRPLRARRRGVPPGRAAIGRSSSGALRGLLQGAPMTLEPLVALDGIRVQFPTGRRTLTAVEGVNLHIDPGETLALVGESGSGKSTIGNVIAGLQRPTAGDIRFRGQSLDKATTRSARREIQIIFQDPFGALDPRMPVSAIIAEPLLIQRIGNGRE